MSQSIVVIIVNGDSRTDFSIIQKILAQAESGRTDIFSQGLQRYQESVSAGSPMSDRELARYLGQTGRRLARKIKAHAQRATA